MFEIFFTESAQNTLHELEKNPARSGLVKQIKKTLGYLQTNPRHPSLQTHEYSSIPNPVGEWKVFEAYAQNRTASAYRIFWCYGPGKNRITVIAVTSHP